jgi:hypothetical protein
VHVQGRDWGIITGFTVAEPKCRNANLNSASAFSASAPRSQMARCRFEPAGLQMTVPRPPNLGEGPWNGGFLKEAKAPWK